MFPGDNEKKDTMDECLNKLKVEQGHDPEKDQLKMDNLHKQQMDSVKHQSQLRSYGIKDINNVCAYPVEVGQVDNIDCLREEGQ